MEMRRGWEGDEAGNEAKMDINTEVAATIMTSFFSASQQHSNLPESQASRSADHLRFFQP